MVERDDEPGTRDPFEDDPDAPASAEEARASARLRDALAGTLPAGALDAATAGDVALALALKAAWDPGALADDESLAVIDATPSASEQHLAAALRERLDGDVARDTDAASGAELALALRAAFAPRDLPEAEHRRLVDAALDRVPVPPRPARAHAAPREGRVIRVAFGAAAAALALAASVFLVLTQAPLRGGHEAPLALAQARTTQPLFREPFKPGETSARIDRIASARASDFRDNRFATWGVR